MPEPLQFRLADRIVDLVSYRARHGMGTDIPAAEGFFQWAAELGRREGEWLRRELAA
jgi:hypothetical protein